MRASCVAIALLALLLCASSSRAALSTTTTTSGGGLCTNPSNPTKSVTCPSGTTCCAPKGDNPTYYPQCCGGTFSKCCLAPEGDIGNTTECTAPAYECPFVCPAWVKKIDSSCPRYCEQIEEKDLCNAKNWNSSCAWCGDGAWPEGGVCQNVNKPICKEGNCCETKTGDYQCCGNETKCFPGAGCVPTPAVCSKHDSSPTTCARAGKTLPQGSCFYCATKRKCINTFYEVCEEVSSGCDVKKYDVCKNGGVCCGSDSFSSICCANRNICCFNQQTTTQYCCLEGYACSTGGNCRYIG